MTGLPDLEYEATTYEFLHPEVGEAFAGETGDLAREHAKAVLALRRVSALAESWERNLDSPGMNPMVRTACQFDLRELRAALSGTGATQ